MSVRPRPKVMQRFYAVVTQMKKPFDVLAILSGQVESRNRSDAEIEVGKYREKLNKGMISTDPNFFIVVMAEERAAEKMMDYNRWRDNHVNPKVPKDERCPACEGQGIVMRKICGVCSGRGIKRKYVKKKT
jgi:hypothetical protein